MQLPFPPSFGESPLLDEVIGTFAIIEEPDKYLHSEAGGLVVLDTEASLQQHLISIGISEQKRTRNIRGYDALIALSNERAFSFNRVSYMKFYQLVIDLKRSIKHPDDVVYSNEHNTPLAYVEGLPPRCI